MSQRSFPSRLRAAACVLLAPLAALAVPLASAQEGHPLTGSWIGEWESNAVHGDSVLLVLNWDGEAITGIINPGTQDIQIKRATLDASDWSVTIEADAEADGRTLSYVIEGQIENLELPSRMIVGTWSHDDGRGAFEVQRQ